MTTNVGELQEVPEQVQKKNTDLKSPSVVQALFIPLKKHGRRLHDKIACLTIEKLAKFFQQKAITKTMWSEMMNQEDIQACADEEMVALLVSFLVNPVQPDSSGDEMHIQWVFTILHGCLVRVKDKKNFAALLLKHNFLEGIIRTTHSVQQEQEQGKEKEKEIESSWIDFDWLVVCLDILNIVNVYWSQEMYNQGSIKWAMTWLQKRLCKENELKGLLRLVTTSLSAMDHDGFIEKLGLEKLVAIAVKNILQTPKNHFDHLAVLESFVDLLLGLCQLPKNGEQYARRIHQYDGINLLIFVLDPRWITISLMQKSWQLLEFLYPTQKEDRLAIPSILQHIHDAIDAIRSSSNEMNDSMAAAMAVLECELTKLSLLCLWRPCIDDFAQSNGIPLVMQAFSLCSSCPAIVTACARILFHSCNLVGSFSYKQEVLDQDGASALMTAFAEAMSNSSSDAASKLLLLATLRALSTEEALIQQLMRNGFATLWRFLLHSHEMEVEVLRGILKLIPCLSPKHIDASDLALKVFPNDLFQAITRIHINATSYDVVTSLLSLQALAYLIQRLLYSKTTWSLVLPSDLLTSWLATFQEIRNVQVIIESLDCFGSLSERMEYVLIFRTEGMLLVLGRIFFAHRKNHVIREKVMLLIQRLATIQGDVEPTLLQMNQIVISMGEAKEEEMGMLMLQWESICINLGALMLSKTLAKILLQRNVLVTLFHGFRFVAQQQQRRPKITETETSTAAAAVLEAYFTSLLFVCHEMARAFQDMAWNHLLDYQREDHERHEKHKHKGEEEEGKEEEKVEKVEEEEEMDDQECSEWFVSSFLDVLACSTEMESVSTHERGSERESKELKDQAMDDSLEECINEEDDEAAASASASVSAFAFNSQQVQHHPKMHAPPHRTLCTSSNRLNSSELPLGFFIPFLNAFPDHWHLIMEWVHFFSILLLGMPDMPSTWSQVKSKTKNKNIKIELYEPMLFQLTLHFMMQCSDLLHRFFLNVSLEEMIAKPSESTLEEDVSQARFTCIALVLKSLNKLITSRNGRKFIPYLVQTGLVRSLSYYLEKRVEAAAAWHRRAIAWDSSDALETKNIPTLQHPNALLGHHPGHHPGNTFQAFSDMFHDMEWDVLEILRISSECDRSLESMQKQIDLSALENIFVTTREEYLDRLEWLTPRFDCLSSAEEKKDELPNVAVIYHQDGDEIDEIFAHSITEQQQSQQQQKQPSPFSKYEVCSSLLTRLISTSTNRDVSQSMHLLQNAWEALTLMVQSGEGMDTNQVKSMVALMSHVRVWTILPVHQKIMLTQNTCIGTEVYQFAQTMHAYLLAADGIQAAAVQFVKPLLTDLLLCCLEVHECLSPWETKGLATILVHLLTEEETSLQTLLMCKRYCARQGWFMLQHAHDAVNLLFHLFHSKTLSHEPFQATCLESLAWLCYHHHHHQQYHYHHQQYHYHQHHQKESNPSAKKKDKDKTHSSLTSFISPEHILQVIQSIQINPTLKRDKSSHVLLISYLHLLIHYFNGTRHEALFSFQSGLVQAMLTSCQDLLNKHCFTTSGALAFNEDEDGDDDDNKLSVLMYQLTLHLLQRLCLTFKQVGNFLLDQTQLLKLIVHAGDEGIKASTTTAVVWNEKNCRSSKGRLVYAKRIIESNTWLFHALWLSDAAFFSKCPRNYLPSLPALNEMITFVLPTTAAAAQREKVDPTTTTSNKVENKDFENKSKNQKNKDIIEIDGMEIDDRDKRKMLLALLFATQEKNGYLSTHSAPAKVLLDDLSTKILAARECEASQSRLVLVDDPKQRFHFGIAVEQWCHLLSQAQWRYTQEIWAAIFSINNKNEQSQSQQSPPKSPSKSPSKSPLLHCFSVPSDACCMDVLAAWGQVHAMILAHDYYSPTIVEKELHESGEEESRSCSPSRRGGGRDNVRLVLWYAHESLSFLERILLLSPECKENMPWRAVFTRMTGLVSNVLNQLATHTCSCSSSSWSLRCKLIQAWLQFVLRSMDVFDGFVAFLDTHGLAWLILVHSSFRKDHSILFFEAVVQGKQLSRLPTKEAHDYEIGMRCTSSRQEQTSLLGRSKNKMKSHASLASPWNDFFSIFLCFFRQHLDHFDSHHIARVVQQFNALPCMLPCLYNLFLEHPQGFFYLLQLGCDVTVPSIQREIVSMLYQTTLKKDEKNMKNQERLQKKHVGMLLDTLRIYLNNNLADEGEGEERSTLPFALILQILSVLTSMLERKQGSENVKRWLVEQEGLQLFHRLSIKCMGQVEVLLRLWQTCLAFLTSDVILSTPLRVQQKNREEVQESQEKIFEEDEEEEEEEEDDKDDEDKDDEEGKKLKEEDGTRQENSNEGEETIRLVHHSIEAFFCLFDVNHLSRLLSLPPCPPSSLVNSVEFTKHQELILKLLCIHLESLTQRSIPFSPSTKQSTLLLVYTTLQYKIHKLRNEWQFCHAEKCLEGWAWSQQVLDRLEYVLVCLKTANGEEALEVGKTMMASCQPTSLPPLLFQFASKALAFTMHYDPDHQIYYYYNQTEGTSTWNEPLLYLHWCAEIEQWKIHMQKHVLTYRCHKEEDLHLALTQLATFCVQTTCASVEVQSCIELCRWLSQKHADWMYTLSPTVFQDLMTACRQQLSIINNNNNNNNNNNIHSVDLLTDHMVHFCINLVTNASHLLFSSLHYQQIATEILNTIQCIFMAEIPHESLRMQNSLLVIETLCYQNVLDVGLIESSGLLNTFRVLLMNYQARTTMLVPSMECLSLLMSSDATLHQKVYQTCGPVMLGIVATHVQRKDKRLIQVMLRMFQDMWREGEDNVDVMHQVFEKGGVDIVTLVLLAHVHYPQDTNEIENEIENKDKDNDNDNDDVNMLVVPALEMLCTMSEMDDSMMIESSIGMKLFDKGVVSAVLQALRFHPNDRTISILCLNILLNCICDAHCLNAIIQEHSTLLPFAFSLIQQFQGELELIQLSLQWIASVTFTQPGREFMNHNQNATSLLLHLLHLYRFSSPDIVAIVLACLTQLTCTDQPGSQRTAALLFSFPCWRNVVPFLVNLMMQYQTQLDLVESIVGLLTHLAGMVDLDHARDLREKALPFVLQMIEVHGGDLTSEFGLSSLAFLRQIMQQEPKNALHIVAWNGFSVLLERLKAYATQYEQGELVLEHCKQVLNVVLEESATVDQQKRMDTLRDQEKSLPSWVKSQAHVHDILTIFHGLMEFIHPKSQEGNEQDEYRLAELSNGIDNNNNVNLRKLAINSSSIQIDGDIKVDSTLHSTRLILETHRKLLLEGGKFIMFKNGRRSKKLKYLCVSKDMHNLMISHAVSKEERRRGSTKSRHDSHSVIMLIPFSGIQDILHGFSMSHMGCLNWRYVKDISREKCFSIVQQHGHTLSFQCTTILEQKRFYDGLCNIWEVERGKVSYS